jgi:long-subunit fatty acid transport protein
MNARTELSSTRQYVLRSLAIGGGSRNVRDTVLSTDNESGSMTLPMGLKAGLSVNYNDKIVVAADAEYTEWSAYKTTFPSSGASGDAFRNSMAFALGTSYTQDINDYNNFLKRVEYRAGFRYEQSNIIINNNGVDMMGISAGLGLPMGKSRSKVNVSFEYLKRGSTSNSLIQEDYFRFILGITFADRWFVRYRYD